MTKFSKIILGKPLQDLQYQDVADFFQQDHGESDTTEFKSYPVVNANFKENIKGVIRAVCGMLNSDGGLVIWGAPSGNLDPVTKEKKFVGALAPVSEYKEKDWMINKISDNISPLPTGIRLANLQKTPTENLYIIEVDPSPYKPHQAESTYHVRLDGQTKPAPHYFIEALFRKISYPNIEGYVKLERAGFSQNPPRYYLNISVLLFNFTQLQNEEDVTVRLDTDLGYFEDQYQHARKSEEYSESKLHFGLMMRRGTTIFFNQNELQNNEKKVILHLTYAGKYSPAKLSRYELDLSAMDLLNPNNTANILQKAVENRLYSELQEKLGTTRADILQHALGRLPNQS